VSVHPSLSTIAVPVSPPFADGQMPDLAPDIYRQRLVIEGRCPLPVSAAAIRSYLHELASVCDMTPLIEPVTHRSERYGWAGWVHWENSGAHFYAWEKPLLFFSVDIYTCKAFEPERVIAFTTDFFSAGPVVATAF
jgi:S-adenosylmethionine decarboxylase